MKEYIIEHTEGSGKFWIKEKESRKLIGFQDTKEEAIKYIQALKRMASKQVYIYNEQGELIK